MCKTVVLNINVQNSCTEQQFANKFSEMTICNKIVQNNNLQKSWPELKPIQKHTYCESRAQEAEEAEGDEGACGTEGCEVADRADVAAINIM